MLCTCVPGAEWTVFVFLYDGQIFVINLFADIQLTIGLKDFPYFL